jgi:hypothetical protein
MWASMLVGACCLGNIERINEILQTCPMHVGDSILANICTKGVDFRMFKVVIDFLKRKGMLTNTIVKNAIPGCLTFDNAKYI